MLVLVVAAAGCTAQQKTSGVTKPSNAPTPVPVFTPVPTVPPGTPTPEAGANPLPTRPIGNPEAVKSKKPGTAVGPVITFLGITRADGKLVDFTGKEGGVPYYDSRTGSGFQLVVEAKPGIGNYEPGRRLTSSSPESPPDLEVQFSRDLGNGSTAVCDKQRPNIGGIPAIEPTSWKASQKVTDTLTDAACRFEIFIDSASSCTVNKRGDFSFITPDSMIQYCMVVAKAWEFPVGETTVTARVLDVEGNPGPVAQFRLHRLPPGTPIKRVAPTKTPTPVRRRP